MNKTKSAKKKHTNIPPMIGSDAYCEIKLHGKSQEGTPLKTNIQKQTLSPKWNETFTVELSHSPMNDTISIFCYGEKVLGKLFIGRVEIPVTLLLHGAMVDGWFKLLPQSPMEVTKTVTGMYLLTMHVWLELLTSQLGHLHLILHYSQVQLPAPQAKPEKSKKSSSSSPYPGNLAASIVNCPICSRPFSALTINQHLDLCTQAPNSKTTSKADVAACPVCCKTFPVGELDRHVEGCLASQSKEEKPKRKSSKPKKTSKLQPSSESEEAAQLQAVLIASKVTTRPFMLAVRMEIFLTTCVFYLKLEAEKNAQEKETAPTPLPTIDPSSGMTPFYPTLPYMPYPHVPSSGGLPMAPPFMPYGIPQPTGDPQGPQDGQMQIPTMAYYPPMYPPPFYPSGGHPFVGAPVSPLTPMSPPSYGGAPPSSATTSTQPRTDLLF